MKLTQDDINFVMEALEYFKGRPSHLELIITIMNMASSGSKEEFDLRQAERKKIDPEDESRLLSERITLLKAKLIILRDGLDVKELQESLL